MSIKRRFIFLVSMFLSVLLIIVSVSMFASAKQQTIMTEIADALSASQSISSIARVMEFNQSQILYALQYDPVRPDLADSHYFPVSLYFDQIKTNSDQITSNWDAYLATNTARVLQEETDVFQSVKGVYLETGILAMINLMKANRYEDAYTHFQQETDPLLMNTRPIVDLIATKVSERVSALRIEAETTAHIMERIMEAFVFFSIVVSVMLSVYSIRIIAANLNAGRAWASHIVTTGDLSSQLDLPYKKDEIADMLTNVQGAFSYLNHGMLQARSVVTAMAHADFSHRMDGDYLGDLAELKQGINGSADAISFMMRELEKVMQGLNDGRFDVKMDTKVPLAFRQLVETALNSINGIVADINIVMSQMNVGDFNSRVNADAAGDLLIMKKNINDSMNNIAQAVTAISDVVSAQAAGDLTKALPSGTFKGQLHDLKNAINYSSTKVKEIVAQAVGASHVVNEAADQVSQGAADLSTRVQEQAAALEQTSATMTEMTSAVQANTANARKVADLTTQVQGQAKDGVTVMQQTIDAMQSIKASSSKIGDIVTLIDSIAFQTNLLALNAAVEAARAGEHGRGFAVVAAEVRALAGKSAEAAKDIRALIEDSINRIYTGTQLADKSGEVLNGIAESIAKVSGMIHEIADVSHEQAIEIGQVHLAIADIDKVTQENAALVEETTAAVECLDIEANNLRNNMAFFKTGQPVGANLSVRPSKASIRPALPAPQKVKQIRGVSFNTPPTL